MAVLGLFMIAATSDLAAQEASEEMESYLNQMNTLAGIFEGISTAEGLVEVEPKVKEVFDNIADMLMEADDPVSLFMEMQGEPRMVEVNGRIEKAATLLQSTYPEHMAEFAGMMGRASQGFMQTLVELGIIGDQGIDMEEEYEEFEEGGM